MRIFRCNFRIFWCNFAKFSRGHAPGPPRTVVLKFICDVTLTATCSNNSNRQKAHCKVTVYMHWHVLRLTDGQMWQKVERCTKLCVYLGFSVKIWVFLVSLYGVFKESNSQPWIWHLFTRHCGAYLESSFANVGNDLRIYLTHKSDQLQWRTVNF